MGLGHLFLLINAYRKKMLGAHPLVETELEVRLLFFFFFFDNSFFMALFYKCYNQTVP